MNACIVTTPNTTLCVAYLPVRSSPCLWWSASLTSILCLYAVELRASNQNCLKSYWDIALSSTAYMQRMLVKLADHHRHGEEEVDTAPGLGVAGPCINLQRNTLTIACFRLLFLWRVPHVNS